MLHFIVLYAIYYSHGSTGGPHFIAGSLVLHKKAHKLMFL